MPSMVLLTATLITYSFDIAVLVLFFIWMVGYGVSMIGNYYNNLETKLTGRLINYLSTLSICIYGIINIYSAFNDSIITTN